MTYDLNTPSAARLWSYHPDWSGGYEVTRSFLTDVITSRNNTEQRRALRDVARLSARYRAVIENDDLRHANHFLRARQNDPVAIPDFSRHALTTGASSGGVNTLTLASPPSWVAIGFLAVLCRNGTTELVRITNVAGSTITLAANLVNAWPSGSVLRPALHGLLSGQLPGPRYHRGAASLQVGILVYPGGEPIEDEGEAESTFEGLEVFPTIEPDWSGQPNLDYLWPVEQVDFSMGRTAQFRPIDMAQRLTEAQFNVSRADAVTLEQFFLRMKGRRGMFWRPTTEKDIVLAATATADLSTFLAEGTDLADDFGGVDYETEPTAIQIVLRDGTRLNRLITDIVVDGDNSEISVGGAWPYDIDVADVARISWMPLTRLASDDLTTSWRTTVSATIRMGFQTLKAPSPSGIGEDTGGEDPGGEDPTIFGVSEHDADSWLSGNGNEEHVYRTTLDETITVDRMSVHLGPQAATVGSFRLTIRANAMGNVPGNLLAVTSTQAEPFGPILVDFPLVAPVELTPGTYWLGIHMGTEAIETYTVGGAALGRGKLADTFADGTSVAPGAFTDFGDTLAMVIYAHEEE